MKNVLLHISSSFNIIVHFYFFVQQSISLDHDDSNSLSSLRMDDSGSVSSRHRLNDEGT